RPLPGAVRRRRGGRVPRLHRDPAQDPAQCGEAAGVSGASFAAGVETALKPFALDFTHGSLRCVSSPTRAALARARAQALVGEDQGGGRAVLRGEEAAAHSIISSVRATPHPCPPPQEGAGALTPSIPSKCSTLKRVDRLRDAVERLALFVDERGGDEARHPLRAVLALDELRRLRHGAVELAQTPCVGVGIALDEPPAAQDLDREIVVLWQDA